VNPSGKDLLLGAVKLPELLSDDLLLANEIIQEEKQDKD
jgi:hypothetical protein